MSTLSKKIIIFALAAGILIPALAPLGSSYAQTRDTSNQDNNILNRPVDEEPGPSTGIFRQDNREILPAPPPVGEETDLGLSREELLGTTPGGQSPTQPNQGQPGQPGATRSSLKDQLTGCGNWGSVFSWECALTISGYFLDIVLTGTAWILAAISNLFNYVAGVTLDNSNYSKIDAITQGWAFSRDVVNLFFIFILLFIAIATILQIESYGAKSLLARLIIIALLVNFSLLAAQFIISLANSLGILFYKNIATGTSPFLTDYGIGKEGFQKDIAGAFQTGLSYQKIFYAPVTGLASTNSAPVDNVIPLITINVILIVGIALMVFAMAVFALAAFLFIVRMTILWLLMILAPFGFVFLILPVTRTYALEWWKSLTKYALFAPAFLFFVIITVKIIQSPIINQISKKLDNQSISTTEFLFLLIIQSAVILILMGGSLIISQRMGIMGANTATGLAQNAGKWFRGYAGRTAWRQFGGAATTSALAATGPALARQLSRIPLVGRVLGGLTRGVTAPITRGAAYAQARARKTYDDQAKAFTNLQPNQLARVLATANPNLQRAILDKTKDKKRSDTLKAMGETSAVRLGKNMKPFGMDKDVAKATNNPATAMKILHPELGAPTRNLENIPAAEWNEDEKKYQKAQNDYMDTLNDKEIGQLNPEEIKNNTTVQASIFQTFNPRRFNALMKNREQLDAVVYMVRQLLTKYKADKASIGVKLAYLERAVNKDLGGNLDSVIKGNVATNLIIGATEGGKTRVGGQAALTIPAGEAGEGETEGST